MWSLKQFLNKILFRWFQKLVQQSQKWKFLILGLNSKVEWTIVDILHNTIYTHHPTPTSSSPGNYWIPINGHLKNIKDEDWLHSNSVLTLLPITPECNLDKILLLLPALVYLCANLVPVLQIDTICKVDVIPLFMQVYRKEQLTEKFHGIN